MQDRIFTGIIIMIESYNNALISDRKSICMIFIKNREELPLKLSIGYMKTERII